MHAMVNNELGSSPVNSDRKAGGLRARSPLKTNFPFLIVNFARMPVGCKFCPSVNVGMPVGCKFGANGRWE